MVYDDDLPFQINVNMVSRCAETASHPKGITLLCDQDISPIARQVEAVFVREGFCVDFSTITQLPPANQDIVSLLDLSAPYFDEISAENLGAFQRYVGSLESTGILWATRSSQMGCKDPRYSQVLGAARTIRSELLIDFATFELDSVDSCAFEALWKVFLKFQGRTKGLEFDPDWEFVLCESTINIPRYHWVSVTEQLSGVSDEELPRKLDMGIPGRLHSLQWVQGPPIVLSDDQLEVETCAVGLNFKVSLTCLDYTLAN